MRWEAARGFVHGATHGCRLFPVLTPRRSAAPQVSACVIAIISLPLPMLVSASELPTPPSLKEDDSKGDAEAGGVRVGAVATDVTKLEREIESVKADRDSKKIELDRLQSLLASKDKQIEQLRAELAERDARLAQLGTELEAAKQEAVKQETQPLYDGAPPAQD